MRLSRFYLSIFLLLTCSLTTAAENITIQLKWFHQFQFAGYYAAIEKGFYAEEGLEVNLRERDPQQDPVEDVLSGKAQYGITDTGLVLAALRNQPVVLVSQIFQHSPLVLMARKEPSMNTVFDLAGKRVSTSSGNITDTTILAMLVNIFGSLDKVNLQPYNFRYDELIEGKTDALAGYITDQPYYFQENNFNVQIFDPRDYGIDFYGDNLFTTVSEASKNPERVRKVQRATLKGWQYALEHPEEIIDLIMARYNTQNTSRDRLTHEAKEISKLILAKYIKIGSYETSRFDKIIATYSEFGFADNINLPKSFYFDENDFTSSLSLDEKKYLKQLSAVRVPLIENQPPLSFSQDGQPAGYLNDLLRRIVEKLNIEIQWIRGLNYPDSLTALSQNQVDLLNDYSSYGSKRPYLQHTRPVMTTPFVAVARNLTEKISSVNDLKNKRLVLVRGFQQTRTFQERYPEQDILLVNAIVEAYQQLRDNKADYYIDNASHAGHYLQNSIVNDLQIAGELPRYEMGELTLRFAINDEHPLLLSAVQKALDDIHPDTYALLRGKWLHQQSIQTPALLLSDAEKRWLEENPVIRVVMDPDWAPVEYQGKEGEYHGMSMDYLEQLGKILGIKFEVVKNLSWQQAVDAVKNRTADMFTSVSKTPQREKFSIFTEPYVSMPIRIFARPESSYIGNIENLAGKKVAVAKGYAIYDWLTNDFPRLDLVTVDGPASGLELVSDGEVDAFIGNAVTASYYINKHELDNVRTAGDTPYANNQAMAVRNDWEVFSRILNKALKSIPQQEHNAIYNRWMSIQFEHAINYKLLWFMGSVALIVILVIFSWNRTLEREVRKRTEKINENERQFRALVNSSPMAMLVIDHSPESKILLMNERFSHMFGYSMQDIPDVNSWWEKAYPDSSYQSQLKQDWQLALDEMTASGINTIKPYAVEVTCTDRSRRHVEITMTLLPDTGLVVFNDVTERKFREELSSLHQLLTDLTYRGTLQEIMRTALDAAEKLTHSQIGFFHFVDDDQTTASLQIWSTRTLNEMCQAEGEGLHYPISQAGVWVDCIRERRAVIHNDYAALTHKKGLPQGHAPLSRELTVPVFRDNHIVAIMGVGNRETEYNEDDVNIVKEISNLAYDFIERKKTEQQIEYMAYNDILTGLPNRELLADRLQLAISQCKRSGKSLTVCYLDLDGFKPVNDRYGHHIGDKLLIELSSRLLKDLREGDTLARLGGDEFVILLNNLATIYDSEEIISRILESIRQPFYIDNHRIIISGSIGATIFPEDNVDADTLLRHADQAMYKSKAGGKSNYSLYDSVQDHKVHAHRKALEEFSSAIQNEQLVLYYQPKVDLSSGNVTGVEALVRWQHPEKGLLAPAAFLPLIQNSPEEVTLGEWVLKTALDQHMHWLDLGLDLPVSVNISPHHIQLRDFIDHLEALLSKYPDNIASKLELEVLETAAIGDTKYVAEVMKRCSELGINFSLDDFGTGYSSLTYFYRLPIDILKIDQNFVRDMLDDIGDLDIVEGVLRLAHALDRPVVAEGVESVEIGMMLLQLGCRYAQGYGIAKPMPATEIPGWHTSWQHNSVWHKLSFETSLAQEFFDLNVSIFSHRKWLNSVIEGLSSGVGATLPDLSETRCQFGRWYNGIGHNRYGGHNSYAFIGPMHHRIHELAQTAADCYMQGNKEELENALKALQTSGEELLTLLRALADSARASA